jgi:hypothetical protein
MVTSQILGLALCRCVLRMPAVTELDHDTLIAASARPSSAT